MTKEELKDALRASIKRPEPKEPVGAITSADEIAMAIGGRMNMGRAGEIDFDIVTNSVVTMQWKRCVPEAMGWDGLVERSYNPFSRERLP
jgi:hypothetical protein